MNNSPQDQQLETFFEELRQEDSHALADFDHVMIKAEQSLGRSSTQSRRPGPLVWGLAGLSVTVAAAFVISQPWTDSEEKLTRKFDELHLLVDQLDPPKPALPNIWDWQSPTAFLLEPQVEVPSPQPETIQ